MNNKENSNINIIPVVYYSNRALLKYGYSNFSLDIP